MTNTNKSVDELNTNLDNVSVNLTNLKNKLYKNVYFSSTPVYNSQSYTFNKGDLNGYSLAMVVYVVGTSANAVRHSTIVSVNPNVSSNLMASSPTNDYPVTIFQRNIILSTTGFTLTDTTVSRPSGISTFNQGLSILSISGLY